MTCFLGPFRAGRELIVGSWWLWFDAADAKDSEVRETLKDESFSLNDECDCFVDALPSVSKGLEISDK